MLCGVIGLVPGGQDTIFASNVLCKFYQIWGRTDFRTQPTMVEKGWPQKQSWLHHVRCQSGKPGKESGPGYNQWPLHSDHSFQGGSSPKSPNTVMTAGESD